MPRPIVVGLSSVFHVAIAITITITITITIFVTTCHAETNSNTNTSRSCQVAGKTWSQGFQYLVGGPNLYPSVYAQCNNGVATCFKQTNVQDRTDQRVACDFPAGLQEGVYLPEPTKRWPKAVACYSYDFAFTDPQLKVFDGAMREFQEKTSFVFLPVDQCRPEWGICNKCQDWFRIVQEQEGCSAYGGFQPGVKMLLNFGQSCFETARETAIHELGHIVGLVHEHMHPNRDVVVLPDQVTVGASQYAKDKQFATTPYDRGSIMHYPRWGGLCVPLDRSKNYCDIINPEPGCVVPTEADCDPSQDNTFGLAQNLSDADVGLVKAMYWIDGQPPVQDFLFPKANA